MHSRSSGCRWRRGTGRTSPSRTAPRSTRSTSPRCTRGEGDAGGAAGSSTPGPRRQTCSRRHRRTRLLPSAPASARCSLDVLARRWTACFRVVPKHQGEDQDDEPEQRAEHDDRAHCGTISSSEWTLDPAWVGARTERSRRADRPLVARRRARARSARSSPRPSPGPSSEAARRSLQLGEPGSATR